jgi:hypothetical protein
MEDLCWNDTRDWIVFSFWLPKSGPSDELIGNFTIHCNSAEYCANDLNFGSMWPICPQGWIILWNYDDDEIPISTINGTFECGEPVSEVINVTTADIFMDYDTVSGAHTDTHTSNNVSENITEVASKGKSHLEHRWKIDVIDGTKTNVTFHVEAWHNENSDDDFEFAYSPNNISFTEMLTVIKTSDDHTYQTATLPNETSGTVYIRVMDTVRSGGNKKQDTIYIDHMFIRSVLGEPDETAPVITNVTNTTTTHNSAIIEWDTDEPADSLVKYGTESGNLNMSKNDTTYETPHSIELTGLDSNTKYYYVVNSTDPSGNSNESEEVYNFTTEPQPSEPDLEITNIWCVYVRKNTYDIFYNITNYGIGDASESVSNLTVDGVEQKKKDSVDPLPSGQTSTEKFTYRGTPGTVKVCADYNNNIDESDEANNCLTNSSCT